jgi:hypothetical protein
MRENLKLRNTEWGFHYIPAAIHVIIQACSVLGATAMKMCQAIISFIMSVCPSVFVWKNSACKKESFVKFYSGH